jgi:hypothetical protein
MRIATTRSIGYDTSNRVSATFAPSSIAEEEDSMNGLITLLAIVAGWLLLQFVILPRLGVPT